MSDVRVAVIGAGRWSALHHIPGVQGHPQARLSAIAEPAQARRGVLADRFEVPVFADVEELLDADLADAVIIASPAAAHHGAALAALEHGLHVLVEKPMTVRPADAWDLVAAARRARCHLLVGFTFQFTRHAARARELVAGGGIGELQLVEATYASGMRHLFEGPPKAGASDDPLARPSAGTFDDPALAGGGQAASQATHVVASMLATSGLRVESVSAQTRTGGLHVDLVDAALLSFAGEAIGTLTSTGGLTPLQAPQWLVRYYGTEGLVIHDLHAGTLVRHAPDGRIERERDLASDERYPGRAPAQSLVDLVLDDGVNPAPGDLGAHAVDVVDALYRSAAERGVPVAIEVSSARG